MKWLRTSVIWVAAFISISIFSNFAVCSIQQKKQVNPVKKISNGVNAEFGVSSLYNFIYKSEGRRDPFVPLVTKRVEKEVKLEKEELETRQTVWEALGYELIGLVWDAKEAFAIIQKRDERWIVKKGDIINNFRVIGIEGEKGEVILEQGHRLSKLRIRGQI